jgi:hypothetical protein
MALPGLIGGAAVIFWRRQDANHAAVPDPEFGVIRIVRANVGEGVRAEMPTIPGLPSSVGEAREAAATAPRVPWLLAVLAGSIGGALLGLQLVERTF